MVGLVVETVCTPSLRCRFRRVLLTPERWCLIFIGFNCGCNFHFYIYFGEYITYLKIVRIFEMECLAEMQVVPHLSARRGFFISNYSIYNVAYKLVFKYDNVTE